MDMCERGNARAKKTRRTGFVLEAVLVIEQATGPAPRAAGRELHS